MELYQEFLDDNDHYVKMVKEYADNDEEHGWLNVPFEGTVYKFPKRALIWYVFGRMTAIRDLLPEYEPFSYSGMKLTNDDRYHTDMILGAGLTDSYHDSIDEARRLIKEEYKKIFTFDFTVLADGRSYKEPYIPLMVYDHSPLKQGVISNINIHSQTEASYQKRCIVIPKASIDYDLAAVNADVIITEQGGPLAHLAIVSREQGKLLIRIDNAVKQFPKFSKLMIDLNKLTLKPR